MQKDVMDGNIADCSNKELKSTKSTAYLLIKLQLFFISKQELPA